MSVLNKLSSTLNRRDEVPNQDLARELADKNDVEGLAEIAKNLHNRDKRIQTDCIKVLYETGYIKPELISEYTLDFIALLSHKNNRMTWGAMIALSVIAHLKAEEIFEHIDLIKNTIDQGSVITKDSGINALSIVASFNDAYSDEIFPYLLNHLDTCRPKDIPLHADSISRAMNETNKGVLLNVLREREGELSKSQKARVNRLIKNMK